MPRTLHIESSISALQNRGGYLRVSVLDNPLDRTFRVLSWLLATASAFVYIINHLACGAGNLHIANGMPLISIGTSLESHWNLIGTSPREHRGITEGSPRDDKEKLKQL